MPAFKSSIFLAAALAVSLASAEAVFRRPISRVASMDPLRSSSVPDATAVQLVYETPLEVDYLKRPYTLKPGICELPEVDAEGLVYTLKLRPGSRFHDDPCFEGGLGRDVVAEDIVYSLKRLWDKNNASSGLWLMANVKSVEAVDQGTVRITLKSSLHVFPWFLAMAYTGVVPHEAVETYAKRFGSHPVGSGAYRMERWRRNHTMEFVRNPNWPGWSREGDSATAGEGAIIDRIVYSVIDDPSTQWLMFLKGELDFLPELTQDYRDAILTQNPDGSLSLDTSLAAKGFEFNTGDTLDVFYIGMNLTSPRLAEKKKLRQALNCAFDFPKWRSFRKGGVEQATGPVPPGVPARLETPYAYSFNLDKARSLLAEAGYKVEFDEATGSCHTIDPATGRRLSFTYTLGRATQADREEAELVKSFYEKVGIDLELRFMTWTGFLQAVDEGRLELFRMGWVGDYPDAENFLQLFHSKNVSPGPNHTGYRSAAFDDAYDRAMEASAHSRADAPELWAKAQEIVREDAPWIFMYHPQRYSLTGPRLSGYVPGDFPYGAERHMRIKF